MKYAHYDKDNKIIGYYDSVIHEEIPTPNIALSEKSWQEAIDKGHNTVVGDVTTYVAPILSAEDIAANARREFIASRTAQVEALTVTVNGKVFNGDEVSQSRMARAIIASGIVNETTTHWTLANNVSTLVTLDELKQALALSMQAMAAIWVQP